MSTNNFFGSDLPKIHNVVQNAMIVYPKEAILATLRDYFSHDSAYHCVKNKYGYPNTTDNTDLPLDAGFNDDISTRLFIGENYRQNGQFYPAVLVKIGSMKSTPVSINREDSSVQYEIRAFEDGYGNTAFFKYPVSFIFAGAWEGSLIIDIKARSPRARDDLIQEIALCLNDITFKSLQRAGIAVKGLSAGSPSEQDDRADKIYMQSITLDIRAEWRREIKISNVIEVINFSVEFANLESPNPIVAQNLTINNTINLLDIMLGL